MQMKSWRSTRASSKSTKPSSPGGQRGSVTLHPSRMGSWIVASGYERGFVGSFTDVVFLALKRVEDPAGCMVAYGSLSREPFGLHFPRTSYIIDGNT